MPLNPYRRSPTWEKITQLIAERNRKMEEVRGLYCEVREIDRLISQLRGDLKPKQQSDQNSDQDRGAA